MAAILPAPEMLAPLDALAWQAAADMAEEAGNDKRAHHCRRVATLLAPGPASQLHTRIRPDVRAEWERMYGLEDGRFLIFPAAGPVAVHDSDSAGEHPLCVPGFPPGPHEPWVFIAQPGTAIYEWRDSWGVDGEVWLHVHPDDLPALCC